MAIKVIRDKTPEVLHAILRSTFYTERRNAGRGLFFDSSKMVVGRQSLQNRLLHIRQITTPWSEGGQKMTNDAIRQLLKRTFFTHNAIHGTVQDNQVKDNLFQ